MQDVAPTGLDTNFHVLITKISPRWGLIPMK